MTLEFRPRQFIHFSSLHLMEVSDKTMKVTRWLCILFCCIVLAPSLASAQAFDVNPYAGFYWPAGNDNVGEFKKNHLFGVRAGTYVSKDFQMGLNWAYSNHFQPKYENLA